MSFSRHTILIFTVVCSLWYHSYSIFAQKFDQIRVVSLSPHITEIIFKLDAESHLIGRTEFCTFPPAASEVESVGGYLNIDFEKMVRLEPDIVLQFPNPANRRKLESLGFEVMEIHNETIDEILDGIKTVGKVLYKISEAQKLCDNIQDTLKIASALLQKRQVSTPAILVVGRERGTLGNIYLAGSNTYLSELWELCGGINVFHDINMRYFSVNEEDLLKRDISVILEFHPGWSSDAKSVNREKESWNLLSHLKAVESGDIHIYTDRFYIIPGPRITQVAVSFMEVIQNYETKER